MAREHRLRIALKGVAEEYDIVLIDCAPSLGLLMVNALTAATHALLITEPRVASVEGLSEIVTTIWRSAREPERGHRTPGRCRQQAEEAR
ncbi:ParA family protein [Arthrobacter sp. 24S4-2]|uniref:ParA family protein n=1 Tax=Arthrobacter sp. 24S4-2 TaxID=2575374 RepID=UPI0020C7BB60|nr:ParA family protein [Arthrobacter sp. 24S4-2]